MFRSSVSYRHSVTRLKLEDASRNPLVQLMFALHSQQDLGEIQLEGIVSERIATAISTRFDVEFHLFQEAGRLGGSVLFATDLFEPETIRSVVDIFQEILRRGIDQPHSLIAVMPLTDGLADLRKMGLLEIEKTSYPRDSSVVDVFREQVATCPNATAVKDSSSELTYAQLDRQSDELAAWLRRRHTNRTAETPDWGAGYRGRARQSLLSSVSSRQTWRTLPLDINVPIARIEAILSTVPGHTLVLLGSDVIAPEIRSARDRASTDRRNAGA